MAGPLSGIGSQTQAAVAAQAQQQSQQNNQGVRQTNEEQRETRANRVQPQNAPTNEAQQGQNVTQEQVRQEQFFASNTNAEDVDPNAPRGSLVDIAV